MTYFRVNVRQHVSITSSSPLVLEVHICFQSLLQSHSSTSLYLTFTSIRQLPVLLLVATSIVHSKLDYCNSFYYKLAKSRLSRLQQIQNSLACTVMKAPKSCHITPILRSLHWLRITEGIEYKLLSLAYKFFTTTQPPYLHNLISVQRPRSTRFHPSLLLLAHRHQLSKITDCSFRYASPCLWNQLPLSLRQPHSRTSSSISYSPIPSPITSFSSDSALCSLHL